MERALKIEDDKQLIVSYVDDAQDVLDQNAVLRSQEQKSDWGAHVASIPAIIELKWLNECWNRGHDIRYLSPEWTELVARKLKDPEWAYLRVDGPKHKAGWGD